MPVCMRFCAQIHAHTHTHACTHAYWHTLNTTFTHKHAHTETVLNLLSVGRSEQPAEWTYTQACTHWKRPCCLWAGLNSLQSGVQHHIYIQACTHWNSSELVCGQVWTACRVEFNTTFTHKHAHTETVLNLSVGRSEQPAEWSSTPHLHTSMHTLKQFWTCCLWAGLNSLQSGVQHHIYTQACTHWTSADLVVCGQVWTACRVDSTGSTWRTCLWSCAWRCPYVSAPSCPTYLSSWTPWCPPSTALRLWSARWVMQVVWSLYGWLKVCRWCGLCVVNWRCAGGVVSVWLIEGVQVVWSLCGWLKVCRWCGLCVVEGVQVVWSLCGWLKMCWWCDLCVVDWRCAGVDAE